MLIAVPRYTYWVQMDCGHARQVTGAENLAEVEWLAKWKLLCERCLRRTPLPPGGPWRRVVMIGGATIAGAPG